MSSNPTGFSPSTIATNLGLWLDASQSNSITTSGSSVTQWSDRSGNGFQCISNILANPLPTFSNVSPYAYVQFADNQCMYVNTWGYTPSWSVFVCMNTAVLNTRWMISPFQDVNLVMMGMNQGANKIFSNLLPSAGADLTGNHIECTMASNTSTTAPLYWYRDGTLQTSNNTNAGVTANTTARLGIGENATLNNARAGTYNVYEIVIYKSFLTDTQRQQVEGYLAWKWGMVGNLPSTHPYKLFPFVATIDTVPRTIPTNAFLLPVNTYSTVKTFNLPVVSTNPGRMLIFKDYLGYASINTIRLSTIGYDTIERSNVSSMALSCNYGAYWFANDGITKWFLTDAYLNTAYFAQPSTYYPANPFILLTPTQTFPTYTTTSAPTFGASYITFPGTSQFLDFGSQALTIGTTGFSAKMKIAWTAINNWARVFDFNSGTNGVTDMFLTFPGTTPNPLRFQYKENSAEQQTNYASNFATNTVYNISVVYNPAIGSVGATTLWVNGTMVTSNTAMTYKATNKTETFTYIGKSSYTADSYLAANVYFMAFYQRPLTDAEASQIL